MKNKIKIIFFLLIIIVSCHQIFKLFIKGHNITYKINDYKIKEEFYIKNKHFYNMIITNKKENYTYTIEGNLHKQKNIIKTIKKYKSNNLICIIPIYKKSINTNIYCNLNHNQVSNDYLIKTNNKDFNIIKNKIGKYNIKLPSTNETKQEYKKLIVYNNNINGKHNYYIWNYKGIYILNKKSNKYKKILDYDLYDNIMNCVVDKYYVLFENNSVKGIENIYYYDSIKHKLYNLKLKEKISKDSYINGVVNNLIYVTDRKNKKEYEIDIKNRKVEEIDENQTNYTIYINGKKQQLSKKEFFTTEQYFEDWNAYEYFIKDSKIYKRLKHNKKSILLLKLDNIIEWKVIDNEIIILVDDTIYSYNDADGLRKIVENNELKYNYKNIYNIGKS